MVDSRSLVPEVYTMDSRDYQVLLKLLDVMINPLKSLTLNFSKQLDPNICPPRMLRYLGNYVGYEVDSSFSEDITRLAIKYYKLLVRNKGNITGISMAVALVLGTWSQSTSGSYFVIDTSDTSSLGVIRIGVYSNSYNKKLMSKLLEVVRPVGVRYEVEVTTITTSSTTSELHDPTYVVSRERSSDQITEGSEELNSSYNIELGSVGNTDTVGGRDS